MLRGGGTVCWRVKQWFIPGLLDSTHSEGWGTAAEGQVVVESRCFRHVQLDFQVKALAM